MVKSRTPNVEGIRALLKTGAQPRIDSLSAAIRGCGFDVAMWMMTTLGVERSREEADQLVFAAIQNPCTPEHLGTAEHVLATLLGESAWAAEGAKKVSRYYFTDYVKELDPEQYPYLWEGYCGPDGWFRSEPTCGTYQAIRDRVRGGQAEGD